MSSLKAVLAAAVLTGALGLGTAHAQLAAGGGPISYSADDLEYLDQNRQLILKGNVDVTQNDARLQSNKLTLYFAPASQGAGGGGEVGSGDIERIIAEGDVHYVRPKQRARGDQAVYDVRSDTVTFKGNVVITSAENVIRGETLVLQVGTGRTVLKPSGKPGERVRGVIRPKQSKGASVGATATPGGK